MKKIFLIILFFYATHYAIDYKLLDSLLMNQEYNNVLDIIDNEKGKDTLDLLYKLVCLNQINKKRFKDLSKKIFKQDKNILKIFNICELLENQKLNKAYKELNKIKTDKFNFWVQARKWELQLLSQKTLPIFKQLYIKGINDSLLNSMYYFDEFIYLYGDKDKKRYLKKINELALQFPDIPKIQLVNFILSKREHNYFNMDYSFQMLWKYNKNKYKNFLNYTEKFLRYYINYIKNNSYNGPKKEVTGS